MRPGTVVLAAQVGYVVLAYAHAIATHRLTWRKPYVSAAIDDPWVVDACKFLVLVEGIAAVTHECGRRDATCGVRPRVACAAAGAVAAWFVTHYSDTLQPKQHTVSACATFAFFVLMVALTNAAALPVVVGAGAVAAAGLAHLVPRQVLAAAEIVLLVATARSVTR
jgi:hypothetical protein